MNTKKKAQVVFANARLLDCPGLYFDTLVKLAMALKKWLF